MGSVSKADDHEQFRLRSIAFVRGTLYLFVLLLKDSMRPG
jgi:hypothetical protein